MSSYAKITINHAALRALDQAAMRALEHTAEQLHGDIKDAMVIPRDQGTLGDTAFFVDYSHAAQGHVELVNSTRYARRLYFHPEYNFHREPWEDERGAHDGNPNAQAHWFEPWADGGEHADFAHKAFAQFYKQEAGL